MSNQTWYGSDGTFIDFATGVYEYPNGTVVHFTPTANAAASTAPAVRPSSTAGTGGSNTPAASGSKGINVAVNVPLGIFLITLALFCWLG
jgi:hypothetical protein